MSIRVLVNGAGGHMGQEACRAIEAHTDLILAGKSHREDDLRKRIEETDAEVVVDFTIPELAYTNASIIIESGAHPVIGTTGMKYSQFEKLQQRCAELERGGIVAPNFSIAAALMVRYAKSAGRHLHHAEIIEKHREGKKDMPSGTALLTALLLQEQEEQLTGKPAKDIPIHSVRLPGFVAHQEVIFGTEGESLTIKVDTIDRVAFMPGMCLACCRVTGLNGMVMGVEVLL